MSRMIVVDRDCTIEKVVNATECRHKIDGICCRKESSFYEMNVDNELCDRCHEYEPEDGIAMIHFTSKLYTQGEQL